MITCRAPNKTDATLLQFLVLALLLMLGLAAPTPAYAGGSRSITVETIETVEYYYDDEEFGAEEFTPAVEAPADSAITGHYGPFRVVSETMAEMHGTVDSYSPAQFKKMMVENPRIALILMVDCDGSIDEDANLRLARMIRTAGIMTHVPSYGSIRSGAVELFLSGVRHSADAGAEFVVHSWMDEDGRQANDYPANDPVHREYLDYYADMGIPADRARAFYDLTNSVPFESQLKLGRADMARFAMLD